MNQIPKPEDYFSKAEVTSAYRDAASLGYAITRKDTDARLITAEQAQRLGSWCDCQTTSLFEDRAGNGWPLQAVLCMWHCSIVYDCYESWLEEDEKTANRAYRDVCRAFKIKV